MSIEQKAVALGFPDKREMIDRSRREFLGTAVPRPGPGSGAVGGRGPGGEE